MTMKPNQLDELLNDLRRTRVVLEETDDEDATLSFKRDEVVGLFSFLEKVVAKAQDNSHNTCCDEWRNKYLTAIKYIDGLAIVGESPVETARRVRVEISALRNALHDAQRQRNTVAETASRLRDEIDDKRSAILELLESNDVNPELADKLRNIVK